MLTSNRRRGRASIACFCAVFAFLTLILISSNVGYMVPVIGFVLIVLFIIYYFGSNSRGPSVNTAPLLKEERIKILKELAGLWDIVSSSAVGNTALGSNVQFSKAYVGESIITLSGGPNVRVYNQAIFLSRSTNGTLYLDTSGTYIEKWDKERQELHIYSVLSRMTWRRPQVSYIKKTTSVTTATFQQVTALTSIAEVVLPE